MRWFIGVTVLLSIFLLVSLSFTGYGIFDFFNFFSSESDEETEFSVQFENGTNITSLSGSPVDLQNALDSASIGDTVLIPEGEFIFDANVNIPPGVRLMGAGQNKTILRSTRSDGQMLNLNCNTNDTFTRISGFTLQGVTQVKTSNQTGVRGLYIVDCPSFRVDHVTFRNLYTVAIVVRSVLSRGVIDHNLFDTNPQYDIVVYGESDASWDLPYELGTEDAVFIEDNVFIGSQWHAVASNAGSRYVFRYNDVYFSNLGTSAVDVHGLKYGWPRGSRSYEIYNNNLVGSGWTGIGIRGGDGVIYDNDILGSVTRPLDLLVESVDDSCNAYPCPDQIRDAYMWGNSYNGQLIVPTVQSPFLQVNRDYYLYQKPGYQAYSYPHPLVPYEEVDEANTTGIDDSVFSQISLFGNRSSWEEYSFAWDLVDENSNVRYSVVERMTQPPSQKLPVYTLQQHNYENFTISFLVRSDDYPLEGSDFAVVLGYQNDSNYYYMLFNERSDWSVLHKIENDIRSDIIRFNTSFIDDDLFHTVSIKKEGDELSYFQDGSLLFEENVDIPNGRVGLGTLNNLVTFDDISIEEISSHHNNESSQNATSGNDNGNDNSGGDSSSGEYNSSEEFFNVTFNITPDITSEEELRNLFEGRSYEDGRYSQNNPLVRKDSQRDGITLFLFTLFIIICIFIIVFIIIALANRRKGVQST